MTVGPGTKLGPYEVSGPLGAGGMGEVWRALDPRLGREVAIKVLPAALAGDPERRVRFERECRLLASLNHPHVASVLGLEDAGGAPALVMELVEGPTLAEKIAKDGAIALPEALALARQIAEAVEYAHERGIVHRDLKPGNVKLTPEGSVKVLDFGLAKALAPDDISTSSPQITQSPTMSVGTQAGVLLGTAAYMAPEQARGKAVDRRADIWAFGVVLFEMLTGRQLFAGETVSDTIARILERQPDWGGLPARTPMRVRELLRRCLEKDAKQRLRDMGDARLELDAAIASLASGVDESAAGTPRASGPRAALIAAAVALAALAGGWALHATLGAKPATTLRFSVVPPQDLVARTIRFSADGKSLLASCVARGAAATSAATIWRRALESFDWKQIPGTEVTGGWDESLDGRWLYVVAAVAEGSRQRELRRVPADGSAPPASIVPWSDRYSTWDVLPDGRVVVAELGYKRFAILAPGATGTPAWRALKFDRTLGEFSLDQSLADGRTMVVTTGYYLPAGWVLSSGVLDLESGNLTVLEENSANPQVFMKDRLLMTRNGAVLAAHWDPGKHRLTSRPVSVLGGLRTTESWSHAMLASSSAGSIGYSPGTATAGQRSLAILHPDGRIEPWSDAHAAFEGPPFASHDGRFAFATSVPPGFSYYQIMLVERGRAGARRFAFAEGEDCNFVAASPNGRDVLWVRQGSDSTSGLYLAPLDGSAPPRKILAARDLNAGDVNPDWYPDGKSILVRSRVGNGRRVLRRVTFVADTVTVSEVVHETYDVDFGVVSPDGTRIAYLSEESGEPHVVVAPLRPDGRAGDAVLVSQAKGQRPRWLDNTTLMWSTRDFAVMAAKISPALDVGAAEKRFDLTPWVNSPGDFEPLPDGSVLITRKADGEGEIQQFDVVLNFGGELERVLKKALGGGR